MYSCTLSLISGLDGDGWSMPCPSCCVSGKDPLYGRLGGPQGQPGWVRKIRFQDNQHTKVVRLSIIHTGPFYPQQISLVLISVRDCVDPHGHSAAGRIMSMKNCNDIIGRKGGDCRIAARCSSHRHREIFSHLNLQRKYGGQLPYFGSPALT